MLCSQDVVLCKSVNSVGIQCYNCVCVCVCLCVCLCVYKSPLISIKLLTALLVAIKLIHVVKVLNLLYACVLCICMYIYMYVCVCMYVCMYVYMYVHKLKILYSSNVKMSTVIPQGQYMYMQGI